NNMGRVFLNMGMPDSAIAAFKRQADLNPYDQYAFNNLGLAYWRERKYQEAADAFQQQIKISPLDHFAHANLGRLYAEQHRGSAVDATTAGLRNLSLDHLGLKDAAAVTSLGAFWDTLGWVYFRQGNLPEAERYVRAAWLLNFYGEEGDHLAQIEERLGRKEDA